MIGSLLRAAVIRLFPVPPETASLFVRLREAASIANRQAELRLQIDLMKAELEKGCRNDR